MAKFKDDLKKGWWYAIKEWWFFKHSGRKTYVTCLLSMIWNYWLYKHNAVWQLWVFSLSIEWLVLKMCEKHAYEVDL